MEFFGFGQCLGAFGYGLWLNQQAHHWGGRSSYEKEYDGYLWYKVAAPANRRKKKCQFH